MKSLHVQLKFCCTVCCGVGRVNVLLLLLLLRLLCT